MYVASQSEQIMLRKCYGIKIHFVKIDMYKIIKPGVHQPQPGARLAFWFKCWYV